MQKTSYYFCRHTLADENAACHRLKVNADELEQAVLLILKKQMEVITPFDASGELRIDTFTPERTEYKRQIEALQDSKMNLYEQYQMGEIDIAAYKAEKTAIDDLLLKTKNAYAAVMAQAKQKQEQQERDSSRRSAASIVSSTDALTDELADLLIDRVYVFPGNRIEIAYKVKDFFD